MLRRRFEVAVRGTVKAVVPNQLCCACGAGLFDGNRSSERLKLPFVQPRTGRLPTYGFPLCDACGRGLALHEGFFVGGGVLGMLAFLGFVAWAWARTRPPITLGDVLQTFSLTLLALGVGGVMGIGASWVAGLVLPFARFGNRVAGAVDYQFESYRPSYGVDDYRCFFLFRNEAYAAAFAAANAPSVRPPRTHALVPGSAS